jgi:hypothetical protein
MLKAFRFSKDLAHLIFHLSRHKSLSIAYVAVANFKAFKRKKLKIRESRCFDYDSWFLYEFILIQHQSTRWSNV